MAKAPRPMTESRADHAAAQATQQTIFHFTIGTDQYALAAFNVPIAEKLAIQGQTGLPWDEVVRPFLEDHISTASLAVLVWAARRASGERGLTWQRFAAEWDADGLDVSSVQIEITGPDGDSPEA